MKSRLCTSSALWQHSSSAVNQTYHFYTSWQDFRKRNIHVNLVTYFNQQCRTSKPYTDVDDVADMLMLDVHVNKWSPISQNGLKCMPLTQIVSKIDVAKILKRSSTLTKMWNRCLTDVIQVQNGLNYSFIRIVFIGDLQY